MTEPCVPESPKPTPIWPVIEADYRAGIKSLRQIAGEHGITEGAIRKRAKGQDWTRDLSGQIQAKADALVRMEAVRNISTQERERVPEAEVIKVNANVVYRVQIALRNDIERASDLLSNLMGELETSSVGADLIREMFEAASAPTEEGDDPAEAIRAAQRQRDLLAKVISLPGRVDSGKKLVEMLEKIVRLKREAYGIDKFVPDEGGIASKLTDAERASRLAAIFSAAQKRANPDAA